jgi:hypothetical protein
LNNTTPDAIFTAYEAVIVGLTPSGGTSVGIKDDYAVIDDDGFDGDPEGLAESELDRQFMFLDLEPQELNLEGMSTSNVITSLLTMVIGHQCGHYTNSRDRMARDKQQLIAQMIHLDNLATGVHDVTFEGSDTTRIREGTYFWTILRFGVVHAAAANYGG